MRFRGLLAGLLLLTTPAGAAAPPAVAAQHGMVACAQKLACEVGVAVLKQGGNAVDAAVAVGYALAVVYPAAGNLGGGGFMTIVFADGRKTFVDFREKAPLAATRDMYLGPDGEPVKGLSTQGFLSVAVPGTVGGLEYAREKYGTLPRAALLDPAIGFAEDGFTLDDGDAFPLALAAGELARDPAAAAIFLHDGRPYASGEKLAQKNLARTLRAIRDKGAAGFYQGEVGEAIAAAVRAGGGIITTQDLQRIAPRELAPISCDYRGYTVVSAPPPSSGGVTLCEMLNVLEGYPLQKLGFGAAQALHDEIETMRHAYVDRNNLLGDPDFVKNPVETLISKEYAAKIRAAIDPDKVTPSAELAPGKPPHEGVNTTHYSIVDDKGDAVSVTYTLNNWFGAGVVAGDTGVLLNDEMDDFTAKVGAPNLYGLVQGEKNAIEPGKTPLSSMTPTIVVKDGKPVLVTGTPGGSRIITVVMQTILNVIDYGMSISEAVDAPRIHNQWLPDVTYVEPFALSPDTRQILEGMGHHFGPPQPANHVDAILIGAPRLGGKPEGGNRFYGVNDPRRGGGAAVGY
ncbi:MAG: gamma-glutamyltransferase [Pseudomonadota bacterium]|nr:gamma-glutamyltransferase [Pseudomonadota bacterium]